MLFIHKLEFLMPLMRRQRLQPWKCTTANRPSDFCLDKADDDRHLQSIACASRLAACSDAAHSSVVARSIDCKGEVGLHALCYNSSMILFDWLHLLMVLSESEVCLARGAGLAWLTEVG